MNALHASLMQSYSISGADSVKLLLMTATPITQNPMELIQLLNLCKPPREQMPTEFEVFATQYLDDVGKFTAPGHTQFLDDVAGYISYLNREKDARQFAQPYVKHVKTPIIKNVSDVAELDNRYVREYIASDINSLKKELETEAKQLEGDLGDLDATKFGFLKSRCDGYIGKPKKICVKMVNAKIKLLLADAKKLTIGIKQRIKEIREQIKDKGVAKKMHISKILERISKNPEILEKFKNTNYYNIKYTCGKKSVSSVIMDEANQDPYVREIHMRMLMLDENIEGMKRALKTDIDTYKGQIRQLQGLLSTNISVLDKNAIRVNIEDARKTMKMISVLQRKEIIKQTNDNNKTKKSMTDEQKKIIKKVKKQITKDNKRIAKETVANGKQIKKEEKRLRKTMRKNGEYTEITNENINALIHKYNLEIEQDFDTIQTELDAQNEIETKKHLAKAQEKMAKAEQKMAKAHEKMAKAEQKMANAQEKQFVKQHENAAKQQLKNHEKEAKQLAKNHGKEAKQLAKQVRETQKQMLAIEKKEKTDQKHKNKTVKIKKPPKKTTTTNH